MLVPGDLADPAHCRAVVQRAADEFGRVDVLVSNAAFQMWHDSVEEMPDEEWDHTIAVNLSAFFHLTRTSLPHMRSGPANIGSTSINSDMPLPQLFAYDATKAGISNPDGSFAQLLGEMGIRTNSVAPGPIWTPLIPMSMPPEVVENFGRQTPLGRVGRPAELAPVHVMLASDEASYVSGARLPVTGGTPIL